MNFESSLQWFRTVCARPTPDDGWKCFPLIDFT
jgi:hypothetical protein